MKKFLLSVACAGLALSARASVTLDVQVADLRTSGGGVILANTTCILVADATGFSSPSQLGLDMVGVNLAIGSTIADGKIIDIIGASDFGSGDYGYNLTGVYDLTTLGLVGANHPSTLGSDLMVFWFPGRTGIGSQPVLSNGESFGYYRSDTLDGPSGGIQTFNMPSDGANVSIYAYDTTLGGGITPGTFAATGVVGAVPEPSRAILAIFGLAGLLLRRRRR